MPLKSLNPVSMFHLSLTKSHMFSLESVSIYFQGNVLVVTKNSFKFVGQPGQDGLTSVEKVHTMKLMNKSELGEMLERLR